MAEAHGREGEAAVVASKSNRTSPAKLASLERRREAYKLRLAGASYADIGTALGVDFRHAYDLVNRELREIEAEAAEDAEQVRRMEVERLDAILLAQWPNRGDPKVAAVILQVSERRSRLLGLDAAIKHEVREESMSDEALAERLAELLAAAASRAARTVDSVGEVRVLPTAEGVPQEE
jgi:hypothetical protein